MILAALALLLACGAARAAEQGDLAVDPYYFEHAAPKLNIDMTGVLTILVDHEGKPSSRGVKSLEFREKPDASAKLVESCARLYPRAFKTEPRRPPAKKVCEVRLLGWTEVSQEDHIQLPVTRVARRGSDVWYEVSVDPEEDVRGWVRHESARRGSAASPVMEHLPLGRWIASTGAVRRRPYRAFGSYMLYMSPRSSAELVANQPSGLDARTQDVRRIVRQPPFDPDAFPLRYLGIQGGWIRVELVTKECRSEAADPTFLEALLPGCVAGWIRWRDADGELFLYPITP